MNKEDFDNRIAKIAGELHQMLLERDTLNEKIKQWQYDLVMLHDAYAKEMNVDMIGRAYEHKRDGSFIIIRRWHGDQASLVAIEFLSPEVAVGHKFMIHERFISTGDVFDEIDAEYRPINKEQFLHRRDEFYKKYVDA